MLARDHSNPRPQMRARLDTVGVTLATPFRRGGGDLDLDGLSRNARWLFDQGIRVVYPCANTGEVGALTPGEWSAVVSATLRVAPPDALVIPGVGGPLPVAREMLRCAVDLGVPAVLVMPVTAHYATERGLEDYYEGSVLPADIPFLIYRRDPLSLECLRALISAPRCVGIKYSSYDVPALMRARETIGDGLAWVCGLAELWAPYYAAAGVVGFTSGIANFVPAYSLSLAAELRAGDLTAAVRTARRALAFEHIRTRDNDKYNVAAVKYAMDLTGLTGRRVRPPLQSMSRPVQSEVRRALDALFASTAVTQTGERLRYIKTA